VVVADILACALYGTFALYGKRLLVSATTSAEDFSSGENVSIAIGFRNVGLLSLHLTFSTGCLITYLVEDANGTKVFSPHFECTQSFVDVDFAPGEGREAHLTWNQTDFSGNLVPVAVYTVKPVLCSVYHGGCKVLHHSQIIAIAWGSSGEFAGALVQLRSTHARASFTFQAMVL
jgi:hypothetical protein